VAVQGVMPGRFLGEDAHSAHRAKKTPFRNGFVYALQYFDHVAGQSPGIRFGVLFRVAYSFARTSISKS
jgi:hypothetical protein